MIYLRFCRVLCVLGLMMPLCVLGQKRASIGTRDTVITVSGDGSGAGILSLGTPAGKIWTGIGQDRFVASVNVDGRVIPTRWVYDREASRANRNEVRFVYRNKYPQMELIWSWQVRSKRGPIEHDVSIRNLSAHDVGLAWQPSLKAAFSVDATVALRHTFIDKGAGKPSAIGTHDDAFGIGDRWVGDSSTYALDEGGPDHGAREIIPFSLLHREDSDEGWYVGIEFSGRTMIRQQRDRDRIFLTVGLNPEPGPYSTEVRAGDTFRAPTIFLGAFRGSADDAGNLLRPWIREVLMNPETWKNSHYPMLVNNSWGSGMQVDESLARRMIRDSADLGLEMFHVDAGWFRGVGDWYADPAKFPSGLSALADEAHHLGLKFGLWVNWAEAGSGGAPGSASVEDAKVKPWLVADTPAGWKPDEFVGRTFDLGDPEAKQFAERETERMVTDYKLDMIEHDGYVVAKGCVRKDHSHVAATELPLEVKGSGVALPLASNSTDVSYHAVRSYYEIQAELRRRHPELLFEICNDGGRMVDFGSAAHGDYFSITDSYDPVSNREAFFDASHVLPAAMLEDYVQKWPTPTLDNFRYMLRSGMMGWLTVMQDTNAWTPEQHEAAKQEFALYKKRLRPLIRDAELYHVSERPDGVRWDGVEYFNPMIGRGVLYAFRGSAMEEEAHTFVLRGLNPTVRYRLHFEDGSGADAVIRGRVLLDGGLQVRLRSANSSELVLIEQVDGL